LIRLIAGAYADFFSFDPKAKIWTDLTGNLTGSRIPVRASHGFVAASGSLYIFHGMGNGKFHIYLNDYLSESQEIFKSCVSSTKVLLILFCQFIQEMPRVALLL
jgi:hypothetical protein